MSNKKEFTCPFEAVAKTTKIKNLEWFRNDIVNASRAIMCEYPEFNRIRDKTNRLLKNIDDELTRLKK